MMKISFKNSLGEEISFAGSESILRLESIEGLSPQTSIEIAPVTVL
ncbi:MAG: hypothetical protein FWG90_14095 [Oscillospiraceae bacterium]|nr:hypothetical protein [Oscillospiraceae bacterium]